VIRTEETKNSDPRTIPYAALTVLKDLIDPQRALTTELERATGRIVPWVFHRKGKQSDTLHNSVAVDAEQTAVVGYLANTTSPA
jgi:hypothetical protein